MARKSDIEKGIKEIRRKYEKKLGKPIPEATWQKLMTSWFFADGRDNDLEDFDGTLSERFEDARMLAPLVTKNTGSNRQPKTGSAPPKKRYQKPLEKRLREAIFVEERRRGRRDWSLLSTEWNKEHPDEPTTPNRFNCEYHRVKADPDVQREYLKREHPEVVNQLASLAEANSVDLDALCQVAGSIALYRGGTALDSTVELARLLLEDQPPVEKGIEVNFS